MPRTLRQIEQEFRNLDRDENRMNVFYERRKIYKLENPKPGQNFWDVLKPKEKKVEKEDVGLKEEAVISSMGATAPLTKFEKKVASMMGSDNEDTSKYTLRKQLYYQEAEKLKYLQQQASRKIYNQVSNLNQKAAESINEEIEKRKAGGRGSTVSSQSSRSESNASRDLRENRESVKSQESSKYFLPRRESTSKLQLMPSLRKKKEILHYDKPSFYYFKIKVHNHGNYDLDQADNIFMIITQDDNESLSVKIHQLSVDSDLYLTFIGADGDPETIFSPVHNLPWVSVPRDLLNHKLSVEVYVVLNNQTHIIAKSTIKYRETDGLTPSQKKSYFKKKKELEELEKIKTNARGIFHHGNHKPVVKKKSRRTSIIDDENAYQPINAVDMDDSQYSMPDDNSTYDSDVSSEQEKLESPKRLKVLQINIEEKKEKKEKKLKQKISSETEDSSGAISMNSDEQLSESIPHSETFTDGQQESKKSVVKIPETFIPHVSVKAMGKKYHLADVPDRSNFNPNSLPDPQELLQSLQDEDDSVSQDISVNNPAEQYNLDSDDSEDDLDDERRLLEQKKAELKNLRKNILHNIRGSNAGLEEM